MTTYFSPKIEKIICPYDFTPTGRSGLEYAGVLARALNARLTLFYVQPTVWPESLQLYEDRNDSEKGVKRHLKVEAEETAGRFGIVCDCAIEPTNDSIELTIGAAAVDYDLIVMGTNGADDLYQHVFGTNSHHVLGLAHCPVLMIPHGYVARTPKLIIYAFDPETNPSFLVNQLECLARPIDAEVRTLTVVPESDTNETQEKMARLGEALGVMDRKGFNWDFEPVYSDEVVTSVDEYMREEGADILALTYHHRTLFEKLFQENVIKEVSRIADYPVLVFWH